MCYTLPLVLPLLVCYTRFIPSLQGWLIMNILSLPRSILLRSDCKVAPQPVECGVFLPSVSPPSRLNVKLKPSPDYIKNPFEVRDYGLGCHSPLADAPIGHESDPQVIATHDCMKLNVHHWTEVSFDNARAPFLRQRFEKMAMEDDPTNGSREKKDRRRTPSLVDILSCSSKNNYPRGFGSQYLLYKICSLDANGQLECLLTSRSSKRDGRSPTNSMTN